METYHGMVRTPADAIKLFEACRLGLLPRVQRRLSEKERQSIQSGSVFVWDEREAGMRRWTDGKSWSASRVSGSFLTYREMEGKRGSGFGNSSRRSNGRTPDSGGRLSDEDLDGEPEGYRYKADGLMKQSFSITTSAGQHLHLISYYSRPHPGSPNLLLPSTDPQLRHITPSKGMYPESSMHDAPPPAMTRTPMPSYAHQNGASPPAPPPQPPAAHHEQPGYAYSWVQPAWVGPWPPSPNHTPPWSHGHLTPEMKPQPRPQQTVQRVASTTPTSHGPIYSKAPNPYDVERLQIPMTGVPLQGGAPQRAYQMPGNHPSSHSPQSHHRHVQAAQAAQAALHIDPRLASARNHPGPISIVPSPGVQPARGFTPPRGHSVSPPRSSGSDVPTHGANKTASLSALLHPTPTNSEPNSANPASVNSANSSPKAMAAGTNGSANVGDVLNREDARAIQSLNRKFCI